MWKIGFTEWQGFKWCTCFLKVIPWMLIFCNHFIFCKILKVARILNCSGRLCRLFFVRFDGNSFHPKGPKLISPGAKLISPMAKLISPTAKLIFWNQKTHLLLSLAPFLAKSGNKLTNSHSKHPRLSNFLKIAKEYWEKSHKYL